MLKPIAFANAFTTVWAVAYLLCFVATLVAPDLVFGIIRTWAHSMSIDALRSNEPVNIASSLFGAITFGAYIWIVTFAGASVYNRYAKS